MLEQLISANPDQFIMPVTDDRFGQYGRILDIQTPKPWLEYMCNQVEMPSEGNIYVPSIDTLEDVAPSRVMSLFGGQSFQVGYCIGRNDRLNALEYHKSPEINVAMTDLILILADIRDVVENRIDSSLAHIFFLPEGTWVELYGTTLHFAPCLTTQSGFKCMVILQEGTNLPLDERVKEGCDARQEERLLFSRNKWLIAHPDRKVLLERGAWPGITGSNLQILTPG